MTKKSALPNQSFAVLIRFLLTPSSDFKKSSCSFTWSKEISSLQKTDRCMLTGEVIPTITAMLTSAWTRTGSLLNPLRTWSHSLPGIPEELQLKHYQTLEGLWSDNRKTACFRAFHLLGTVRGDCFFQPVECLLKTIKDIYKNRERKHPQHIGMGELAFIPAEILHMACEDLQLYSSQS